MALLHDIQTELLRGDSDLAPILLKLKFLASKLGSHPLAEWVKYEAEGYPAGIDVPTYRHLDVNYKGTFSGPFGSGIRNAPIPSYLIHKFAGANWSEYKLRQSAAAIDKLVSADKDGAGVLTLNASDLILILQGKIYENYACNSVEGTISVAQLKEVQQVVRSRILEISIEIENSVPAAATINIGNTVLPDDDKTSRVNQIFHQTIHGNMTNLANTGSIGSIAINVIQGDQKSVQGFLEEAGFPKSDARQFSDILASESPESESEPFGSKAKTWIAKNISKAVDGSWKVGIGVATDVLKKAALNYYGFPSS